MKYAIALFFALSLSFNLSLAQDTKRNITNVKGDIDDALTYLQDLRTAVLTGLKAGKSVEQLTDSITMEKYKDWANYDNWRALNVQGMARHLKAVGAVN